MHKGVAARIRNKNCDLCKLSNSTQMVCQVGVGKAPADVMVVSKMPNSDTYHEFLTTAMEYCGIDPYTAYYAAASKCRSFEENATPSEIKLCARTYLDKEIRLVKPKWIITLGNEALLAVTGHSGIMKYRGKPLTHASGAVVIPTLSPASVQRNPGQTASWYADLRFIARKIKGIEAELPEAEIAYVMTKPQLKAARTLIEHSQLIAYDVETVGDHEFASDAAIVSLSVTLQSTLSSGQTKLVTLAIPLYHPQSPWRKIWPKVLQYLKPALESVPKQLAHNGKYDARWMRRWGVNTKVTFDTLIAAHLLDENREKGLKPQAQSRLGVEPWGIDTRNLLTTPIMDVLKYNGLDTYHTYHIYPQLKQELLAQPRLLRLFKLMLMPANEMLIEAERRGIWTDRERVQTRAKISLDMRDEIDAKLMTFVPDPEATESWPTKGKRAKKSEINFNNASDWFKWWFFEYLGLPVLERTNNGKPSAREAVMLELKGQHEVVDLLLERSKWQKYSTAFFPAYLDLMDENDRIHTNFKLTGTVTGRLSSGKEDEEKLMARAPRRGVNLQQVPRDNFVRGVFGAQPGWWFVEADFSQVELRLISFVAPEPTMKSLYQQNKDIHAATAAWVLGIPEKQVGKDDRKKAKAVNFGFAYGMYPKKFVATAFEKYELVFTLHEAEAIRAAFFNQFKGLIPWHNRMKRLAHEYGRVQSPIGRIRHLPDINSPQRSVQMEAERQAINSPIQAMASDMNQIAAVLIDREFRKQGLRAHVLGLVHDAINFEVHRKDAAVALPLIQGTMEDLRNLKRMFGVAIDLPILADLKVGTHWGDAEEISRKEIQNWKRKYAS